jgi:uncharacterized protein involved in copper resistance
MFNKHLQILPTRLTVAIFYEIKREVAPYIGIRYQSLLGETMDIAELDEKRNRATVHFRRFKIGILIV